ncbi:MAG: pentapeptide repeat-containing protein [Anaerolineae bacterium]
MTYHEKSPSSRWQEIQEIWKDYKNFYKLLRGFIVVALLLAMGAYIFVEQLTDFSMNVLTEAIGVLGTVLIVDILARYRAENERKQELIFQMGSDNNLIARSAVMLLKQRGWTKNGSLKNAQLGNTNLSDEDLVYANLEKTSFVWATCVKTNFSSANLRGADFYSANLEKAIFSGADLENSNFRGANLTGAVFSHTRLQNADLRSANMSEAFLMNADITGANLEKSTLPDGTRWTSNTDMRRFTDPTHSDFWYVDRD